MPVDAAEPVLQDPELPALAGLLDPEGAVDLLRQAYPDAGVTSARPGYMRYKRHTSCLVAFDVRAACGATTVYARAHNLRSRDKLRKAAERESVASALGGGIVVLHAPAVVVYPFPNDHELPALRALRDRDATRELLTRILPEHPELWAGTLERLRHKPERRFVARLRSEAGSASVKLYDREGFRHIKHHPSAFVDAGPLRVPRRLWRSPTDRTAVAEWIEGEGLWTMLCEGRGLEACRLCGAALAALHAQRPRNARRLAQSTPEESVSALVDSASAVGEIAPHLAKRAARLAHTIAEHVQRWTVPGAVHGDFAPEQVVMQVGVAGFIDLDRAGCGDPRLDLGSFGARLACAALHGDLDPDAARNAFAALLEGYRSASNLPGAVAPAVAGGLLKLAMEPFRHCRPQWSAGVEAIIRLAEEVASGRGGWSDD